MIDLITAYPKLFLGIFTPLLLVLGYFYRVRIEKKKNKKLALYLLMEIWHRMSVFYRQDFDDIFEKFLNEIKKKLPGQQISDEEISTSKVQFLPIISDLINNSALSDLEDYQERYQQAVSLISEDDPIFAYKISSASNTKKFLAAIDAYINKSLAAFETAEEDKILAGILKKNLTGNINLDAIQDLEKHIKHLAMKISIITYFKSISAIKKRKKNLQTIDDETVEEIMAKILMPSIHEYVKKSNPLEKSKLKNK